jgi:hypothetical protein
MDRDENNNKDREEGRKRRGRERDRDGVRIMSLSNAQSVAPLLQMHIHLDRLLRLLCFDKLFLRSETRRRERERMEGEE